MAHSEPIESGVQRRGVPGSSDEGCARCRQCLDDVSDLGHKIASLPSGFMLFASLRPAVTFAIGITNNCEFVRPISPLERRRTQFPGIPIRPTTYCEMCSCQVGKFMVYLSRD